MMGDKCPPEYDKVNVKTPAGWVTCELQPDRMKTKPKKAPTPKPKNKT
jgi:hypothetical protein